MIKDAVHAIQEQEQHKEDVVDSQIIKQESFPVLRVVEDTQNKWNFSNEIYTLTNKLDSLLELIQDQQQEISDLRVEVSEKFINEDVQVIYIQIFINLHF